MDCIGRPLPTASIRLVWSLVEVLKGRWVVGVLVVHVGIKDVAGGVDDLFVHQHLEERLVVVILCRDFLGLVECGLQHLILLQLLLVFLDVLVTLLLDLTGLGITHKHRESSRLAYNRSQVSFYVDKKIIFS